MSGVAPSTLFRLFTVVSSVLVENTDVFESRCRDSRPSFATIYKQVDTRIVHRGNSAVNRVAKPTEV